jgi:hypothetical protein
MQYCADLLRCLPADGTRILINTPGWPEWSRGPWVEVSSGLASAAVLTGVEIVKETSAGVYHEVDVGVGGAGAETVIATVRDAGRFSYRSRNLFELPVPIDAIPAGTRIAVRGGAYWAVYGANTTRVGVTYLSKPLSPQSTLQTTSSPMRCHPPAAASIVVAGAGAAGAWSAWREIVSATPVAWAIAAVVLAPILDVNCEGQVELGIGAAGDEQSITQYPVRFGAYGYGGRGGLDLVSPLDAVPAGARLAYRFRTPTASTANTHGLALNYYELPL